jgi:hypothetical protein
VSFSFTLGINSSIEVYITGSDEEMSFIFFDLENIRLFSETSDILNVLNATVTEAGGHHGVLKASDYWD